MFNALKTSFLSSSEMRLVSLRSELDSMRYDTFGEKNISEYMMKFKQVSRTMTELGDTSIVRQFILAFLKRLPIEFSALKVVIENTDQEKLTWENIAVKLIDFEKETRENIKILEKAVEIKRY